MIDDNMINLTVLELFPCVSFILCTVKSDFNTDFTNDVINYNS